MAERHDDRRNVFKEHGNKNISPLVADHDPVGHVACTNIVCSIRLAQFAGRGRVDRGPRATTADIELCVGGCVCNAWALSSRSVVVGAICDFLQCRRAAIHSLDHYSFSIYSVHGTMTYMSIDLCTC